MIQNCEVNETWLSERHRYGDAIKEKFYLYKCLTFSFLLSFYYYYYYFIILLTFIDYEFFIRGLLEYMNSNTFLLVCRMLPS